MFKFKGKTRNFIKRQVAKALAIVMAFSTIASSGMSLTTAYADQESTNDYGKSFVQEVMRITELGTPYVYGGNDIETGVDCRALVRIALKNVYGTDLWHSYGYLVDDDDNPILDKNGDKIWYDVAAWDPVDELGRLPEGTRICVEGKGLKTYYRLLCSGTCNEFDNTLDIDINGRKFSSLIAYACQFPGSIIAHNRHYGIALGEYHSPAELIADHPELDGEASGTVKGQDIIRWKDNCYDYGNSYSEDNMKYWFGKTIFFSASSTKNGLRADNYTTTGKDSKPTGSSQISILICEGTEESFDIEFEKVDRNSQTKLAGATYGVYSDSACDEQVAKFETKLNEPSIVTLKKGTYFVKELIAPDGYELSEDVLTIDVNKDTSKITLYDSPVNATIRVQKVDANNKALSLSGTLFEVQEYNGETYEHLVNLSYVDAIRSFTITDDYTNNEETLITDKALHYTNTNKGYFKLVEVGAQPGYTNSMEDKIFNIEDGENIRLTGAQAVVNTAKMSLEIHKFAEDGKTPIKDAEFRFEYNGTMYPLDGPAKTDENGVCVIGNIPEGENNTGKLYEVGVPEPYFPTDELIYGMPVALSKATLDSQTGSFKTVISVKNYQDDGGGEEPTTGSLIISKTDASRDPSVYVGVEGAKYSVYTDETLETLARGTVNGQTDTILEDLPTDELGLVAIDDLPVGVYYVRETEAPKNYAIQPKTFAVNVLSSMAVDGTIAVETEGVMDDRQAVVINVEKKDADSGEPVANVVFELCTQQDMISPVDGKLIEAGTLVGYYKTDENGKLTIDQFGSDAIYVDGEKVADAVEVFAEDGTKLLGDFLVNGRYELLEYYTPKGYVSSRASYVIKAGWVGNSSATEEIVIEDSEPDDQVIDGGVVSVAGYTLTMDTIVVENKKQSASILINKLDAETETITANTIYNLEDYDVAVDNGLVATLDGAQYQLKVKEDVKDVITGEIIEAGTILGLYTTGTEITEIEIGRFQGNPIPLGEYELIEVVAPAGYALDPTPIPVSVTSASDFRKQEHVVVEAKDEMLKQAVTIKKLAGDTNQGLSNVTFRVYSVAKYLDVQHAGADEIPWATNSVVQNGFEQIDRTKFEVAIAEHEIPYECEVVTDIAGEATTPKLPYGDYIIYEVGAPDGYKVSNPVYIQVPWVEETELDQTYFVHNVSEQPSENYVQTIVNAKEDEETLFTLTIVKIDSETGDPIIDNPSEFSLIRDGVIIKNNGNDTWETNNAGSFTIDQLLKTGTYILEETKAPEGYIGPEAAFAFTVTESDVSGALVDGTPLKTEYAMTANGLHATVYVPNDKIVPDEPEIPTIDFEVTKIWEDNNNERGLRPNFVTVQLYADGKEYGNPIVLTAAKQWKHTWEELKQYTDDGEHEILYTVDELEVIEHYEKTVDGGIITNTCTYEDPILTSFTVNKVWDDDENAAGERPESIEVQLYADGVPYSVPVTLTEEKNWTYTWDELPKHNDESAEIDYTVNEVDVPEYYDCIVSGSTIINVYNKQAIPTTHFNVLKLWDDQLDLYGLRPDSVTVKLYEDGIDTGKSVVLSTENEWQHSWTELPLYHDDGVSEIVYTVVEDGPIEFYESSIDGGIITNTCTYKAPQVIVSKYEIIGAEKHAVPGATLQILDQNGEVVVLADGSKCEWVTPNAGDTETVDEYGIVGHLFDGLMPGNYVLHELFAPAGYVTSADIPFVVTNTTEKQYVSMVEDALTVSVSKVDAVTKTLISGAELMIIDEAGEAVLDSDGNEIKWTSTTEPHVIRHLSVGNYFVREIKAPNGYQKSTDIPFSIIDSAATVDVTVENERTYGTLELIKKDKATGNPLEGVAFKFVSVNTVYGDNGEVLYSAGETIDTLVTDENGFARMSCIVPIGEYKNNTFNPITYKLIETKAADGQYDLSNGELEVVFLYQNDETEIVKKEYVIENEKPIIEVTKSGTPLTFEGRYEDRNNVTVVKDGDIIEYTVTIKNKSTVPAYNILVKDVIPQNTILVSEISEDIEKDLYYKASQNAIYWNVPELSSGDSLALKFKVKVTSDEACEIINVAQYAMPANTTDKLNPDIDNISWDKTNAVVHQVVSLTKSSEVPGGYSLDTATPVSSDEQIDYKIVFESVNDINNLQITDIIPQGMTYVSGSAKANGVKDDGANYNPDLRKLTFSKIATSNGKAVFEFSAIVNKIDMGQRVDFINVALAEFGPEFEKNEIESNIVTHYAKEDFVVTKTATPKTFEGNAKDVQNATILKKGDEVTYKLCATNKMASTVKNVLIVDKIPDGMEFVSQKTESTEIKVWVDKDAQTITWLIPEIEKDVQKWVEFTAVVKEQKAQLITNKAQYASIDDPEEPKLPEKHYETNDVVHQVIEFHKTSDIKGGTNKINATPVAVGDTITYTLELIAKNNMTNVIIEDEIPEGLSFVPGSIYIKTATDTEWTPVSEGSGAATTIMDKITYTKEALDAGTYYLKFDVTVDHVPMNNEKFYINQALVSYDVTPTNKENRETIKSEEISHMTVTKIEGYKTGEIDTYVGDYDQRHDVTVVEDGDKITYVIAVSNMGISDINGLIIKDVIPENTTFVSVENGGAYDKSSKTVTWIIDTLPVGTSAQVKFTVKCDAENKATEIRNKASYAVPENKNNIKDDEWFWTDEVIYQTVKIEKDASIDHGTTGLDAKSVAIGKEFTYKINLTTTNTIYGFTLEDEVPDGLSVVAKSAKYTLPDGTVVKVNDAKVDEDNVLRFPTIDELPAGVTTFSFKVVVDDVKEYDREYFFINEATATLKPAKNSKDVIELVTNTVSHKTIKTNETGEPVLGFEGIDESMAWGIIALTSAITMIACGLYGFGGKNKKNRRK